MKTLQQLDAEIQELEDKTRAMRDRFDAKCASLNAAIDAKLSQLLAEKKQISRRARKLQKPAWRAVVGVLWLLGSALVFQVLGVTTVSLGSRLAGALDWVATADPACVDRAVMISTTG